MPDYFASPKQKLARAQKHIEEFKRETKAFLNEHPWAYVIEPNADGRFNEHKLRLSRDFADSIIDAANDAIGALRAVLDQAGYAAARASGIDQPSIGKTAFPFGYTDADVQNSVKRGICRQIPADIVALMCSFKPYRTEDSFPLLWSINKAANIDKHALLQPVGACVHLVIIGGPENLPNRPRQLESGPEWRSAKNEIVFALSEADKPNAEHRFRVVTEIAFGEIEALRGKPVLIMLHDMTSVVESILMAIEAETKRLFPNTFL